MPEPKKVTRGIRNNNAGNIRKSKEKWQGLASAQPDKDFFTFTAPEWGIRALARVLISYQDKHGLNTIDKIIRRWAPPNENDTPAYQQAVARDTGFRRDDVLDMHHYAYASKIVRAIIRHENGVQPYDDATIDKGLALAGIMPPKKDLKKSRTVVASQVTAVSSVGIGAGAVDVITSLSDVRDQASSLSDSIGVAAYIALAASVAILIASGVVFYARWQDNKRRIT